MDKSVLIAFLLACVSDVNAAPRVFNINPRQGSSEGATVITIKGEGFSQNQFSYGDGNEKLGNRVFLRSGARSVECEVQIYRTNQNQILCETRKAAQGWYNVFIMVDGVPIDKLGGKYCKNHNDCRFNYLSGHMPNIKSISPKSGPPGTLVTIQGDIYSDYFMDTQDVENPDTELQLVRVYVGGAPCTLLDETTEQLYGLKRNRHKNGNKQVYGKIVCKIEADYTDSVNGSFIISGNKGRSRILPQAYTLSAKNELYLFQIHPEIATISPETGSEEGGSVITINGKGFENELLEVSVGGLPCQVRTVTSTRITCTTQKKDTLDPTGNRGLLLEVWPNSKPSSVDLVSGFNTSGAGYFTHVVQSSQTPSVGWFNKPDYFSARLRGFFIPPSNNTYTFHLIADDVAVLYLSSDDDPANKAEVLRLHKAVPAHDWFQAQSKSVELVEGKMYYMEGVMVEYTGHAHLKIGVRIHNTALSSRSLSSVLADEQEIKFSSTYSDELQVLTIVNNTSPFKLVWDGAKTKEIAASASAIEVEEALKELLSAKCVKDSVKSIFTRDYDTPKKGQEWGWRMNIYSYCGRESLMLGYKAQTAIFHKSMVNQRNKQYGTYNLERYNTLCLAYTGELVQHIRIHVWWKEKGTGKEILTERVYQHPFIGDSEWHYTCVDLMILVSSDPWFDDRRQQFSEFKVEKITLETSNDVPTFVDEVFIGERQRSVTRNRGAVHPNGVYIDKIIVTKEENWYNISVSSLDCGYGLPLLGFHGNGSTEVNSDSESTSWEINRGSTVEIRRLEALAPPIEGSVVIGYNGMTTSVDPDLSAEDMKAHLESSLPGIGNLEVKRSGDCSGYTYTIRWPNDGGAMPLFTIVESNLTGVDVNVTTYRRREGGLLLAPIPGDMLRSYHEKSQVTVTINGIPAGCYGKNCTFEYSQENTPVVNSISPATGTLGTAVTISGSGMSPVAEDNVVMIGGAPCLISTATESQIVCTLGEGSAGAHKPVVTVAQKGAAKSESGPITVRPTITSLSPSSGSSAGGLRLTISGTAFSKVLEENSVLVDGHLCEVVSSTFGVIVCLTPNRRPGGNTNAPVVVSVNGQTETSPNKFNYDSLNTAKVTHLDRTVVPVTGGVITFTGTGFGISPVGEIPVMVGDTVCMLQRYSDTSIKCQLPSMKPGNYAVRVILGNGYADASLFPSIECKLEVTGVWPRVGTMAGGSLLTIAGTGFSAISKDNVVAVGSLPCTVESSGETVITCTTGSSYKTHTVTNMGSHPEIGQGYEWSPQHIEVKAGDWVEWKWHVLPGVDAITYGIQQTANSSSNEYDGTGFKSQRSANGAFRHQFTSSGTFSYSAGSIQGRGNLHMIGTVTVSPAVTISDSVNVKVNNITAMHATTSGVSRPSSSCPDGDLPSGCSAPTTPADNFYYTYSDCSTPHVASISPRNATTGTVITIKGNGFGTANCQNKVQIGTYSCDVVSSSKDTLTCSISPASGIPAGISHAVQVVVQGLGMASCSEGQTLTVNPSIDDFSPKHGSLEGGTKIRLQGSGFSSDMTITLGNSGSSCKVLTANYTNATCVTTKGNEDPASLSIHLNGFSYDVNRQFAYKNMSTPKVLSVSPKALRTSRSTVVIVGEMFMNDASDVTVSIGGTICNVVAANSTHITCVATDVVVGSYKVKVNIGTLGYASCQNPSACQVTVEPVVTDVKPKLGSTNGGTKLTITGVGFDSTNTKVLVGGQPCVIDSVSATRIVCTVPANKHRLRRSDDLATLTIESNSQGYPKQDYEYSSSVTPVVTSINPKKGRPGSVVTISGSGFSSTILENMVQLGDSPCSVTSSSVTEIQCTVGEHVGGVVSIQVNVAGVGLAVSTETFEYELVVDSVSPSKGGFGGGLLLSLTGTGFDALNTTVSLCNEICRIVQGTTTKIDCVVPALKGAGSQLCDVAVKTPSGAFNTKPGAFQYDETVTARISSVTPTRGGTAGGTKVTVHGNNFLASGNTVTVGGTQCVVSSESTTQIECTTGEHRKTEKTTVVVDNGHGQAVTENAAFHYVDVWSSPFTWSSKGLPKAKDFVIIPKGQTILLDMDTPIFEMLLIQGGHLIFDEKDITLNSQRILITDGGRLEVGTEEEPFQHRATITLHGHVRSKELPVYGTKSIAVREGHLELHGKPIVNTWTRLSETVHPGDLTIKVMDPVKDWKAGDTIVMATTSHRNSQKENEELIIKSVSQDGVTVTLESPVKYKHISTRQVLDGEVFETRAEVGLLTRNVIVQGSVNDEWTEEIAECPRGFNPGQFATQTCFQGRYGKEIGSDQFGSQIMIHGSKEMMAVAHIEYIEVRHAGQAFRLGRYPIHFHMNGNVTGSYVRGCAIHHTFNRALTMHGVHNLLVERNVAFNNMGHAYFMEDGIETNNVIQHNLGIFTKTSSSLLNTDVTPATFWVTNPDNILRHNAAAGGSHFGFWYNLPQHPGGPSYTTKVCPRRIPVKEFTDNSAHSFGRYGLWIFMYYDPREGGSCDDKANHVPGIFGRFTVWHCERGAEVVGGGSVQFHNFLAADNEKSGLEAVVRAGPWGENGPMMKDSVVIGWTANSDDKSRTCTAAGITTPKMSREQLDGIKFINFDQGRCAALRHCSQCKARQGGFPVRTKNLKFVNAPNKVAWKWEHEGWYEDLDGTLTGIKGGKVVPTTSILPPNRCVQNPEFSHGYSGSVCDQTLTLHRMAFNGYKPESLEGKDLVISNEYGHSELPFKKKRLTHPMGWMATMMDADRLNLHYKNADHITNISYTGGFYEFKDNEYVTLSHNFTQKPDSFTIRSGKKSVSEGSESRLRYDSSDTGDWYFDDASYVFTYMVSGKGEAKKTSKSMNLKAYRCLYDNCGEVVDVAPVLGKRPEDAKLWSRHQSWVNVEPGWGGYLGDGEFDTPSDGDDVMIPKGDWIVADVELPRMNKLYIYGTLELDDTRDHLLDTTYIIIQGGRLVVGYPDAPFTHNVNIILQGHHRTPDVNFPDATVGSKAIGVFGGLDLHGSPVEMPWTRLAKTADVGDDTLTLEDAVDWKVGNEIVIATTSYEAHHTETFEIEEMISERIVRLKGSLKHRHLGDSYSIGGKRFKMAAEVGLLTRNIVIEGFEEDTMFQQHYGARVLIGSTGMNDGRRYKGFGRIENVEFRHTGQDGFVDPSDPRFSLSFLDLGDITPELPSYVKSCSFHHGFSTAVGVFGTNNLEIIDNVIHHTVSHGIEVEGQGTRLIGNLVTLTLFTGTYNGRIEAENLNWVAGIMTSRASDVVLKKNVVAGSEMLGYWTNGELCNTDAATYEAWQDNTAHSCLHGIHMFKYNGHPGCSKLSNFNAYRNFDYGIYFQTKMNIEVSGCTLVENGVNVMPMGFSPPSLSHQTANKYASVSSSLVVGSTPSFDCSVDQIVPVIHTKPTKVSGTKSMRSVSGGKVGILWPTFTSAPNGAPFKPWDKQMSYPTINGLLKLNDVTFADFSQTCGKSEIAIHTPVQNGDCMHPIEAQGTQMVNVTEANKVFIHYPMLKWVNPSDCVDMDCDAQKKAIIRDMDGGITGMKGGMSTIIPQAEHEWGGDPRHGVGDYRIPKTMLSRPDGSRIPAADIVPNKGLYRTGCQRQDSWHAHVCQNIDHNMIVIESLDADTETRRVSPLSLSSNGYVDLINGPMDHGWCFGYTCQERISTFYGVVATGKNYDLHFTGTSPQNMRVHLLNVDNTKAFGLGIWYSNPQRLDVYHKGVFVAPTNAKMATKNYKLIAGTREEFMPKLTAQQSGTNWMDKEAQTLHILIRGTEAVEIKTTPIIQLSLELGSVTIDEFYEENLVRNLADLLNISPDRIRVMEVVRETRLRRAVDANTLKVKVEIGDPPLPQLNSTQTSDQNGNYTGLQEPPMTADQLNAAMSTFVNQVQLGQDNLGNMSVVNMQVVPSVSKPIDNTYGLRATNTTVQATSGQLYGQTEDVPEAAVPSAAPFSVVVPRQMHIHRHPSEVEENAIFSDQPQIYMLDAFNDMVPQLGMPTAPWEITAAIVSGANGAILLGKTSMKFENGWANFTNLAISGSSGENFVMEFMVTNPSQASNLKASSEPFHVRSVIPWTLIAVIIPSALAAILVAALIGVLICKKKNEKVNKVQDVSRELTELNMPNMREKREASKLAFV